MTYLGPVDGHDVESLIALLNAAKDMARPVLVHVMTHKGRGYEPAEREPSKYHGVGKFDPATGTVKQSSQLTFSQAFGTEMCALAAEEPKLCAITAAMPGGTGLLEFKKQYPKRLFDVGIAEEHAVSMAGGMAKQGLVPVVALYSTFLQRSYDMLIQDIALMKLPVVFAVDRAGLVGEDGETHHGIFDVGFLRQIPGMRILCPCSCEELRHMLRWAVKQRTGPVAIRYPRGGNGNYTGSDWTGPEGTVVRHRSGDDATIITYGTLLNRAMEAAERLAERGVEVTVLRLLSVSDLPAQQMCALISSRKKVFIMEEVCEGSGVRESVALSIHACLPECIVTGVDLGRNFVTHGSMDTLYHKCGLDAQSVCDSIMEVIHGEN